MEALPRLVLLLLSVWITPVFAVGAFSDASTPLKAPPRVIGFYSNGCLAGAEALPLEGKGYRVMRPNRNRYYGHPALITFLQQLARQTADLGERLLIGDLSQPRGGSMAFGHRSHQTGLDADIWFRFERRYLSRKEAGRLVMRSVVNVGKGELDLEHWSPMFRAVLKLAADAPDVERIFVNPVIKLALCRSEQERVWLRKLRPWWGHDAHFHVRLNCPPDSNFCEAQTPPPAGDGCNEGLEQWVMEQRQITLSSRPRKPPKHRPRVMPKACQAVLFQP